MREKAERWLVPKVQRSAQPEAEEVTHYGDRIEIRRLWSKPTTPEAIGLYAASQVFVVQREVIPTSKTWKRSCELCYAITSADVLDDAHRNARQLLRTFRGHWSVESKNHNRRDVTYREDRSPVKNHNAARVLATMKMLAIFLCEIEAHRPTNDRERSLPEFNRFCAINGIGTVINWMKRTYNPLRV